MSPYTHLFFHFYFTPISISSGFPSLAVFLFLLFFHFILSQERIFPEQVELKVLFLDNFAGKCQCSRLEVYSISPYLPMLNFLMALQVSHQHILMFCIEGGSENSFTFLLNIPWTSPVPHPLFPFIWTRGSSAAWSFCWTWQLHWRRMTVLWGMLSAKFFGTENQAVTLHLSLCLMNRIYLLLDECFVLKDPAGSWPAFISPMWWLTRHF